MTDHDLGVSEARADLRARLLTFRDLIQANLSRVVRWHPEGLASWSPLEWAGAMAGEAGEACNAAKKLKRIDDQIQNINEPGRSLTDRNMAAKQVAKEVADTIIYGALLVSAVDEDLEATLIEVFNQKSQEYGFPERLREAAAEHAEPSAEGVAASEAQGESIPSSRVATEPSVVVDSALGPLPDAAADTPENRAFWKFVEDTRQLQCVAGAMDSAAAQLSALQVRVTELEQENETFRAERLELHAQLTGKGEMAWVMGHPDGEFQTELGRAVSVLRGRLAAAERSQREAAATIARVKALLDKWRTSVSQSIFGLGTSRVRTTERCADELDRALTGDPEAKKEQP